MTSRLRAGRAVLGAGLVCMSVWGGAVEVRAEQPPDAGDAPREGREGGGLEELKDRGATEEQDEQALFELEDAQWSPLDPMEAEQRRVDEAPLSSMGVDEARARGFVFGSEVEDDSRTSATLMATTLGLLVHGAGHWQQGEARTASILLGVELAGLALAGGGLIWQGVADESRAARVFAGPAMVAGTSLFAGSYLADVMGTVKGGELGFSGNAMGRRGISGRFEYDYMSLDGYPGSVLQTLSVGLRGEGRVGAWDLETAQDVFLETSTYRGEGEWRPWRGVGSQNYVFVGAGGEWLRFRGTGEFRRVGVHGRVGGVMDLGQVISQLRQIVVGGSLGWGRFWYGMPGAGPDGIGAGWSVGYIPLEMYMSVNLGENIHARVGYERMDGSLLQSDSRLLGLASGRVTFRTSERADLVLGVEVGGGVGLKAGLRVWIWEPRGVGER